MSVCQCRRAEAPSAQPPLACLCLQGRRRPAAWVPAAAAAAARRRVGRWVQLRVYASGSGSSGSEAAAEAGARGPKQLTILHFNDVRWAMAPAPVPHGRPAPSCRLRSPLQPPARASACLLAQPPSSPARAQVYNIEQRAIEPVGGAARFMTAARAYERDRPLTLFSGDCLNPRCGPSKRAAARPAPVDALHACRCSMLAAHAVVRAACSQPGSRV